MSTISKEAESKLINSVQRAVSLVDDSGLSPDTAIAKVAVAEGWQPEMIRLASHAYNTGRQTAQRQAGDSVIEKFAEFELADPDKIISAVWSNDAKEAAETARTSKVSEDYSQSPERLFRGRPTKAAASLPPLTTTSYEPYKLDAMTTARKTYSDHLALKRAFEERRRDMNATFDSLNSAVHKLANYFKQFPHDRLPFATVEKVAAIYFGDAGKSLSDVVYGTGKVKDARAEDDRSAVKIAVDFDTEPFSLVKVAIDLGRAYNEKVAEATAAYDQFVSHMKNDLSVYDSKSVPDPGYTDSLLPEKKQAAEKSAGIGTALGFSGMNQAMGWVNDKIQNDNEMDKEISKGWLELDAPEHDAELRKIRAQSVLAQMMQDDVIGGYSPEEVINAYNELAQTSPRAVEQPIALKSMLRRVLQGEIEPHEAEQFGKIEKGVVDTTEGSDGSLIGHDEIRDMFEDKSKPAVKQSPPPKPQPQAKPDGKHKLEPEYKL